MIFEFGKKNEDMEAKYQHERIANTGEQSEQDTQESSGSAHKTALQSLRARALASRQSSSNLLASSSSSSSFSSNNNNEDTDANSSSVHVASPTTEPLRLFTARDIARMTEGIRIDVFDILTRTTQPNPSFPDRITISVEKRWIAGMTIPMTALYQHESELYGTFPLDSPFFSVGYAGDTQVASNGLVPPTGAFVPNQNIHTDSTQAVVRRSPTLTFALATHPLLSPPTEHPAEPDPAQVNGETNEEEWLLEKLRKWRRKYLSYWHYYYRTVEYLGMNMEGNDCLITRYILPQNPPDGLFYCICNCFICLFLYIFMLSY